jgi:large subunit ribosomal protein L15
MAGVNINKPVGATKKKKIVGRGAGSGKGSTAGRGTKGQNSRSGGSVRPGFEGGQMPLYRRIARRGFSNYPFKKEYALVKLGDLNVFADGETVDRKSLVAKGLLTSGAPALSKVPIKILGNGEISKKLIVNVDKLTAGAKEKIEKAGGKVATQAAAGGAKKADKNGE